MDRIKKFSAKFFPNKHGFARSVAMFYFPQSQFLLQKVELLIGEIEGLWCIAFDEVEEGTSLSVENCLFCRREFNFPVGQFWYQVAIQDFGLEKLSQANKNTTFSNSDENQEIIQKLKDAWTNLLFEITGFEEALFKLVSSTIARSKLPISEQNDDGHPLSLNIFEATQTIRNIAKNVDEKLYQFSEDPRVLESYSLYLPLLSMLGIEVTIIKEPEPQQQIAESGLML